MSNINCFKTGAAIQKATTDGKTALSTPPQCKTGEEQSQLEKGKKFYSDCMSLHQTLKGAGESSKAEAQLRICRDVANTSSEKKARPVERYEPEAP